MRLGASERILRANTSQTITAIRKSRSGALDGSQNSNGIADNMREVVPLAAALATERSERIDEEAEENLYENGALTHHRIIKKWISCNLHECEVRVWRGPSMGMCFH